MLLSGKARLAGVMGWPIGHSLSPRLHGHWILRHGLDAAYVPLAVPPDDMAAAFALLPRLGFLGWNVTLPHKEAAFRLVDERDVTAERTGSVNTVLVYADGRTRGYSTDGEGFLANLRHQAPGWRPESRIGASCCYETILGIWATRRSRWSRNSGVRAVSPSP